ncbi:MAG: hypothetical protein M1834_004880 [Cirrosporium novae-zelandiae]|nr:MAG: hypothetical protein M1834_004880 [Cirrosporium novae-zelandiae]
MASQDRPSLIPNDLSRALMEGQNDHIRHSTPNSNRCYSETGFDNVSNTGDKLSLTPNTSQSNAQAPPVSGTETQGPSLTQPIPQEFHDAEGRPLTLDDTEFRRLFSELLENTKNSLLSRPIATSDRIKYLQERIFHHDRRRPLKWRIENCQQLSFLFQSYLQLIEDGLTDLEESPGYENKKYLNKFPFIKSNPMHSHLESDSDSNNFISDSDSASEPESAPEPEPEYTIRILNRKTWLDFERKYTSHRVINEESTLDILIGDPAIPYKIWKAQFARTAPKHLKDLDVLRRYESLAAFVEFQDQKDAKDQREPKESKQSTTSMFPNDYYKVARDSYTSMPSRLRVNGVPLIILLEKMLDVQLSPKKEPVVLLRSFKLLVHRNDQIRRIYSQLKEKFKAIHISSPDQMEESNSEESPNTTSAGEIVADNSQPPSLGDGTQEIADDDSEDLLDNYGTEQAYKELSCLIEFIDNDLKVLSHFKNGSPKGSENNGSDKDRDGANNESFNKAYRIPGKISPFVIDCYYMDFDGMRYGPIAKAFEIQKYNDLKEVTSLPIYPIKFTKDPEGIKKKFFTKGKKFLEVSRREYRQYSGPNLHEQEEIDSQIIEKQDKDKNWQFKFDFGLHPPPVANKAEVKMVSAGGCDDKNCCENDNVFNNIDLDHRRMDDYITDRPLLTKEARYLNDDQSQIPEDLILFPNRLFAFVLNDRK